mgnify:CR=1 FL=1
MSEEEGSEKWLLRHLPLILVAVAGIAWGVRLEERLANHLKLPYHGGMRETRDSLIEIKAELRYLREDVQGLKAEMQDEPP